jgi:hypothetical protein
MFDVHVGMEREFLPTCKKTGRPCSERKSSAQHTCSLCKSCSLDDVLDHGQYNPKDTINNFFATTSCAKVCYRPYSSYRGLEGRPRYNEGMLCPASQNYCAFLQPYTLQTFAHGETRSKTVMTQTVRHHSRNSSLAEAMMTRKSK